MRLVINVLPKGFIFYQDYILITSISLRLFELLKLIHLKTVLKFWELVKKFNAGLEVSCYILQLMYLN